MYVPPMAKCYFPHSEIRGWKSYFFGEYSGSNQFCSNDHSNWQFVGNEGQDLRALH